MDMYSRYSLREAVNRLLEAETKMEKNWKHNFPEAKEDECGRHWQASVDMDKLHTCIWELLRSLGMEEDYPNAW